MRRKKLTQDTSSVIQSLFKKKSYFALSKNQMLQLWTIVLGTVTQYSYLSDISPFPHKKVHPLSKFSWVLNHPSSPPSPFTKVYLGKNRTVRVNHWGEVRGRTGVYLMEKASEKQKSQDFCPWTRLRILGTFLLSFCLQFDDWSQLKYFGFFPPPKTRWSCHQNVSLW